MCSLTDHSFSLGELEDNGFVTLGRGQVISKLDIRDTPGQYPVYSSAATNDGVIGKYGKFMFDDERLTWSIDGGGRLFYRSGHRYSVTNVCGWLKVNSKDIFTKYLYYQLLVAWARRTFDYTHKAHPSVIRVEYTGLKFPPLPTQRAIAEELDRVCELKRTAEKLVEKYRLLIKAKFSEMFGDGMVEKFPRAYIGELFDVGSSKRVFQKDWVTAGVPFYRAREVVRLAQDGFVDNELFITEEMFSEYSSKYGVPSANDILVTGVGTLGVCYLVKKTDRFYYKDGNIICLHSKNTADSIYVRECYKQQFLKRQIESTAGGSTVGTYTIENAKKTWIPCPPLALQREFAAFVEKVEKLEAAAKATVEKYDILYRSKLQEYFG